MDYMLSGKILFFLPYGDDVQKGMVVLIGVVLSGAVYIDVL